VRPCHKLINHSHLPDKCKELWKETKEDELYGCCETFYFAKVHHVFRLCIFIFNINSTWLRIQVLARTERKKNYHPIDIFFLFCKPKRWFAAKPKKTFTSRQETGNTCCPKCRNYRIILENVSPPLRLSKGF